MLAQPLQDAVQLLRTEYLELPGLALTPSDVAGLLDLDDVTAAAVLQALEDASFLERRPDGTFVYPHAHDLEVAFSHR